MNEVVEKGKEIFVSDVLPFLKKYGVAIAIFLFGLHLHAQVFEWSPFWDDSDSLLYNSIDYDLRQTQAVTARWLMISGCVIIVAVHYDFFHRLRQRTDPKG